MHLFSTLIATNSLIYSIVALPQAAPPLPTSAFALEGYAKNNPTAAVSGGAGGPTTTVTANEALQSAVKVSHFYYSNLETAGMSLIDVGYQCSKYNCKRWHCPLRTFKRWIKQIGLLPLPKSPFSSLLTIASQIIGHPDGANITKNGITITSQDNVIIRNLKIAGVKGNDGITLSKSKRIWIDHNEFYSDPDLVKTGPDLYVCAIHSMTYKGSLTILV